MAEWFVDWFNSEDYLTVYRHHNEAEARKSVNLILSSIIINSNARILDMGCGAGRHSLVFAEKGFEVTAVDLSEYLINFAKNNAAKANLKIKFLNCDFRKYKPTENFDLAVNLFSSFGYFDNDNENFQVCNTIFNCLNPGGYFVIDFLNKGFVEKNLIPVSVDENSERTIVQVRSIEGERVIKKIMIQRNGIEKQYLESVRLYSKEELLNALFSIGFTERKILGDFDGNNFDLETSPRIIIIVQK
ncbi:MAG: class I SAM-dependent methyltransferase [Ignavibacteriaceae bacterium]